MKLPNKISYRSFSTRRINNLLGDSQSITAGIRSREQKILNGINGKAIGSSVLAVGSGGGGSTGPYINKLLSIQANALIGLWDFQEASGAVVTNYAPKLTSGAVELGLNGGFERAGTGGADVWANWYEIPGNGAIADEGALVHGGSHAAKLTAGASANTYLYQDFIVKPGQEVTFTVWTRGDGTNSGRYMLQNAFTAGILINATSWNVTGTDYTQASFTYTPAAGVNALRLRLYCPAANGGICYYDDMSVTAITDCTALYPTASVTYHQPGPTGMHNVPYSAKFLGAASGVGLGSGGYHALHNPDVGSAIGWGRVNAAGVWTDATTHRYLWHPKDSYDPNYYLVFGKYQTVNNSVFWRRKVGAAGNSNEQVYTFTTPPLDWFCMGYSWDISIPRLKGYIYAPGNTPWTKVFDIAGVGMDTMLDRNWSDPINTLLMAGGTNSQLWQGWGGVTGQWAGITLSDGEMQRAMTL